MVAIKVAKQLPRSFRKTKGHLGYPQDGEEALHGDFASIAVFLQQGGSQQCSHTEGALDHYCCSVLHLRGTDSLWCPLRHKEFHLLLRKCLHLILSCCNAYSLLHLVESEVSLLENGIPS
ncbi:uncharacterized protein TNIN_336431 [Trichonephila inaurata madagascariensis]|uniref:Uncharacterized protein n=1 Tax=Trichonephila inaurata madagascariensis TaxID=2747483 RepID=A0A8X6MIB2_9ARAC|nr:uncharacterized protein TNIN_336431 [Trichonephila inaurata madagascariensis]